MSQPTSEPIPNDFLAEFAANAEDEAIQRIGSIAMVGDQLFQARAARSVANAQYRIEIDTLEAKWEDTFEGLDATFHDATKVSDVVRDELASQVIDGFRDGTVQLAELLTVTSLLHATSTEGAPTAIATEKAAKEYERAKQIQPGAKILFASYNSSFEDSTEVIRSVRIVQAGVLAEMPEVDFHPRHAITVNGPKLRLKFTDGSSYVHEWGDKIAINQAEAKPILDQWIHEAAHEFGASSQHLQRTIEELAALTPLRIDSQPLAILEAAVFDEYRKHITDGDIKFGLKMLGDWSVINQDALNAASIALVEAGQQENSQLLSILAKNQRPDFDDLPLSARFTALAESARKLADIAHNTSPRGRSPYAPIGNDRE